MAQNRRPEAETRDGSSSSEEGEGEEEEEGSSEENEAESEAESEQEEQVVKTTSTPLPPKPSSTKKPDSDDDDESGSESDSESDSQTTHTRRPDPNIKPISSKPMEEPPLPPPKATKKPRSKPSSSSTPAAKPITTIALPAAAAKRPMESVNNSNRESKRSKKKAVDGEEEKKSGDTTDPKKQLFQRLWSEDDEIVILKGMIEYSAKKGSDPVADMNAFHDFIKKSLHVDVSKTQLVDKVRRLKKKYENNASKAKNGEDRTFSKTHEHKAFELSKKIWGGEVNAAGGDSAKVNGKGVKKKPSQKKVDGLASPEKAKEGAKMEVEPSSGVLRSVGFDRSIGAEKSVEDEIIKHGLDLISGPKKTELEEKWKKLRVEEVELYLKRVDLIREQTKLVLDVLKSSGH